MSNYYSVNFPVCKAVAEIAFGMFLIFVIPWLLLCDYYYLGYMFRYVTCRLIIIIALAYVMVDELQWNIYVFLKSSLLSFPLGLVFHPAPSRCRTVYLRIPPRFGKCNNCENIKGKVSESRAKWMFSNGVSRFKVLHLLPSRLFWSFLLG